MQWITKWAFNNKAAMKLVVLMALAMGVISYFRLPMEFLPEADNPMVTVAAIGPGYDAKSMETEVTNKLEDALQFVKGKSLMTSSSGNGFSKIDLAFDSKTNMKEAKAEVETAVRAVQLPERVMAPYVVQFNTSMIPISWVSVGLDGVNEADREQAEKELINAFKKVDGAGQVSLGGKSTPSISIIPDKAKLEAKKLPYQTLMGVLQGRSVSASIGEKTIDGASGNIIVEANVGDLDTLRKLPVAEGVALGDVAEVKLENQQESISSLNGKNVLMLTISKTANANAVKVGDAVQDTVERLNKDMKGVDIKVLSSTSEQVVHSVNSMLREVLMGALFATIVILLFMRNIRATLVTIVSIPLSLGITLYLLQMSGVTLNIITLGGVAVAVGRLVDDSIVVIENIYRRLQKETFSVGLIVDATKEVATAITSSTLVTVAVFLPMGLLRGSLQAFLLPFALTVTYSLLSSLLVALTVVPLLSAVLLRNTKMKEHEGSKRFSNFLGWCLAHKWVPLVIAVVLLIGSVGAYMSMPKGAIDSSNAANLNISLEYPSETPHDAVVEGGRKLEAFLTKSSDIDWVLMQNGNSSDGAQYGEVSSPTLVTYLVQMKKGADAEKVIADVQGQRSAFKGADLNAGAMDFMSGSGGTQVIVDVTGDDLDAIANGADQVVAAIKPVKDVLKVKTNQEEKKPVYTFQLDPSKSNGQEVASQLQGLLNPIPLGSITIDNRVTNVVLQPSADPASQADLNGLTIMTASGPVDVSSVAKLVKSEQASVYYHKDGKPYVRVAVDVDPKQLSIVGKEITKKVNALKTPEGVTFTVGGASADQSSDFADLGIIMLVAIGIVYLIMVLTFKTLRAPLAIMCSLPLAAIGAVVGLLVTGISPDFTAVFGALMLVGIVVTNAIVLIDRVKQNEQRMTIREALIEAAATRARPILMTAIATISAMLPLVFGSTEGGSIVSQSLAIVVIGGLAAATLLTLIIVPCIYELFFFRKSKRQRVSASVNHAA
ncbi:efflux RND transporter permease subunit [Paenibacillus sacheonensis]|uniref:AcrB/AcrD/AcrF family protein n=1 Tax=Paenibacillus sacheonensis TaxID=742054 RepID=A0A7X4YXI8_9BACL|nr:efflux RND transporter permease subunit [Paenibacillus sacheonensis]MBM7564339.1 HAE1 family hydrophobic/amphiphilic exporter-1 [Paenibacillus sacheonensis]NBC73431.1 AcrB/AcrD/AcrF family protein [Paenibacillus sacheonensis]